jgi:hypothetical protein
MARSVVRSSTAGAIAGVAWMALAACGAALSSTAPSASAKPSLTEPQLRAIALRAAREAGDPHPTLIQHSEGTRRAANLVDSGAVVAGNGRSYLIAERGRFVLRDASVPAGAKPPRGSVLTLVVAARSHQVTDFGVSDRYPDLARLGPVTTDLRRD